MCHKTTIPFLRRREQPLPHVASKQPRLQIDHRADIGWGSGGGGENCPPGRRGGGDRFVPLNFSALVLPSRLQLQGVSQGSPEPTGHLASLCPSPSMLWDLSSSY